MKSCTLIAPLPLEFSELSLACLQPYLKRIFLLGFRNTFKTRHMLEIKNCLYYSQQAPTVFIQSQTSSKHDFQLSRSDPNIPLRATPDQTRRKCHLGIFWTTRRRRNSTRRV